MDHTVHVIVVADRLRRRPESTGFSEVPLVASMTRVTVIVVIIVALRRSAAAAAVLDMVLVNVHVDGSGHHC